MTAIELTMDDVHRDKEAVRSWLHAHDLDPLCTQPGVRIEDGRVYATLYIRDDAGKIIAERDPVTDEFLGPKTEDVVREQRQALPAGLGTVIA